MKTKDRELMKLRILLIILILVMNIQTAVAYEFPFTLVKFKPHFYELKGEHIILKYAENIKDKDTLNKIIEVNDKLFEKSEELLGLDCEEWKIRIYIYNNHSQKRKLTGNRASTHIEKKSIHKVLERDNLSTGDIVPVMAEEYFGRCEAIFLNIGLKSLCESPIPEIEFSELEKVFVEHGLTRPLLRMIANDAASQFNDVYSGVTSASFVKFLLTEYPKDFFSEWYSKETKDYDITFHKIYGFTLAEGERQWLNKLVNSRLDGENYLRIKDILIKKGFKIQ